MKKTFLLLGIAFMVVLMANAQLANLSLDNHVEANDSQASDDDSFLHYLHENSNNNHTKKAFVPS